MVLPQLLVGWCLARNGSRKFSLFPDHHPSLDNRHEAPAFGRKVSITDCGRLVDYRSWLFSCTT